MKYSAICLSKSVMLSNKIIDSIFMIRKWLNNFITNVAPNDLYQAEECSRERLAAI